MKEYLTTKLIEVITLLVNVTTLYLYQNLLIILVNGMTIPLYISVMIMVILMNQSLFMILILGRLMKMKKTKYVIKGLVDNKIVSDKFAYFVKVENQILLR